jgi:hypothetical protein
MGNHVLLGTDYPTPMIDAGQVSAIRLERLTRKTRKSFGQQRRSNRTDVKSGTFAQTIQLSSEQ